MAMATFLLRTEHATVTDVTKKDIRNVNNSIDIISLTFCNKSSGNLGSSIKTDSIMAKNGTIARAMRQTRYFERKTWLRFMGCDMNSFVVPFSISFAMKLPISVLPVKMNIINMFDMLRRTISDIFVPYNMVTLPGVENSMGKLPDEL
jgi:hypothetical protein